MEYYRHIKWFAVTRSKTPKPKLVWKRFKRGPLLCKMWEVTKSLSFPCKFGKANTDYISTGGLRRRMNGLPVHALMKCQCIFQKRSITCHNTVVVSKKTPNVENNRSRMFLIAFFQKKCVLDWKTKTASIIIKLSWKWPNLFFFFKSKVQKNLVRICCSKGSVALTCLYLAYGL